ncbi:MAG: MerR family transcriptional regulator [Lachnospiraceae bacterium]|nr:MerR family transcriptional regulator [Lachnospiraceae bacterium]
MKIKEVETATGLTQKSIRLYEAKGLIEVARNADNDYRDYSEENVEKLKYIKLYRYLGFSIEEIKGILYDKNEALKSLREMIETIKDEKEKIDERDSICRKLIEKEMQFEKDELEAYLERVNLVETDEFKEFKKVVRDVGMTSTLEFIIQLMIGIAPIISLFINISYKKYNVLFVSAVMSIVGTVYLTFVIKNYLSQIKNRKIEQKEADKGWGQIIACIVVAFIVILVLAFSFESLVGILYSADSKKFVLAAFTNVISNYLMIIYFVLTSIFIALKIIGKFTGEDIFDWGFPRKTKVIIAVVFVFLSGGIFYFVTSNMVVVNEETIVVHSMFDPEGKEYKYSDIEVVKAGYNRKGEAYYTIAIGGKEYKLTHSFISNEKYEDTYDDIYALDKIIIKNGVKKETSHDNEEYQDLDKKYKNIFSKILDEK